MANDKRFKKLSERVSSIYTNPRSPYGLGGVARLKKGLPKVPLDEVINVLRGTKSYSLHKAVRKKIKTSKVTASGIDHIWSMDLADVNNIAKHNDGFKYLLFIIDTISRYLWIQPIKSKRPKDVARAFLHVILTSERRPGLITTDSGMEFLGRQFTTQLDDLNIGSYRTGSQYKASIAERVIRTIKERMYRYFTATNSYRYIDALEAFVESYNNSTHRTIKMKPNAVTMKNYKTVMKTLYPKSVTHRKPLFNTGDYVRIAGLKGKIAKGYTANWSTEIFKIDRVIEDRQPSIMYRIKDFKDQIIKGSFYREELQRVNFNPHDLHEIERVVERVGRGARERILVKWLGWPNDFNSYISSRDLVQLSHI